MLTSLSVNLSDFRALCRDQIARGVGFDVRELAGVEALLKRMETEALRLESIEAAARALEMAERAVALLDQHPVVDIATFEAAVTSDKVVIFPGARGAFERRPS